MPGLPLIAFAEADGVTGNASSSCAAVARRVEKPLRDYERLSDTLKGLHQIALAILFVKKLAELLY